MNLLRRLINRSGYHLRHIDDLTRLMNECGSDKGWGLLGRHNYTRVYDTLFAPLREKPITFVELGLLRPDWDSRRVKCAAEGASSAKAATAPSLLAWRDYFRAAQIVGFDIDDFSAVKIPQVKIIQGDMSDPQDLARLIAACPDGIDVLIDDASHISHHQQIAFGALFPHLNPGGIYVIEDCHWQEAELEKTGVIKTRDLFHDLRRTGTLSSPYIPTDLATRFTSEIASIRFYDSCEPVPYDTEDALCVITKKS